MAVYFAVYFVGKVGSKARLTIHQTLIHISNYMPVTEWPQFIPNLWMYCSQYLPLWLKQSGSQRVVWHLLN